MRRLLCRFPWAFAAGSVVGITADITVRLAVDVAVRLTVKLAVGRHGMRWTLRGVPWALLLAVNFAVVSRGVFRGTCRRACSGSRSVARRRHCRGLPWQFRGTATKIPNSVLSLTLSWRLFLGTHTAYCKHEAPVTSHHHFTLYCTVVPPGSGP